MSLVVNLNYFTEFSKSKKGINVSILRLWNPKSEIK